MKYLGGYDGTDDPGSVSNLLQSVDTIPRFADDAALQSYYASGAPGGALSRVVTMTPSPRFMVFHDDPTGLGTDPGSRWKSLQSSRPAKRLNVPTTSIPPAAATTVPVSGLGTNDYFTATGTTVETKVAGWWILAWYFHLNYNSTYSQRCFIYIQRTTAGDPFYSNQGFNGDTMAAMAVPMWAAVGDKFSFGVYHDTGAARTIGAVIHINYLGDWS